MYTLVEVVDQLEGATPVEEGDELEKVVCPVCGEIFNQLRQKVKVCAFVAQKPTQAIEEEKEAPSVDMKGKY